MATSTDVLIVGGGPSALSAALCLSRARYTTVIFDSGSYRNEASYHMHMFPTWDHKDPKEFRRAAREELQNRYNSNTFVDKTVTKATRATQGGFEITDADGQVWYGRKLILATGVKDILPDIPGYEECWIKGIYHCLFCHGYEDSGAKSVGVLAIDYMAEVPPLVNGLARNALQFTDDVTIYTNGSMEVAEQLKPMVDSKGIKIDDKRITRLVKEPIKAQVKIEFEDGSSVIHDFLVHGSRNKMPLDYAKELKLEVAPSGGEVKVVNPFQETTEPGCFAVGDMGSIGKIVVAGVAFGTFAATGIVRQLQME